MSNAWTMPTMVPSRPISGASVTAVSSTQTCLSILGSCHMIASSMWRSIVSAFSPREASAEEMIERCSEPS